jgi:Ca2+-binding RTX toxin-like protein
VDTTLVGGAGADTYTASSTTLNSGDRLNGGAGNDTLAITSNATAAATVGGGVTSDSVETVTVTATVSDLEVALGTFTGVTTVGSNGSTTPVSFTGLTAIPAVNVTATGSNVTVAAATTVTAGTADSATITLNGATGSAGGGQTVRFNGIETINLVATGATSGSADSTVAGVPTAGRSVTVASTELTTLAITGTAGARVVADLVGSSATITGTVTSAEGSDDVTVTAGTQNKVSVNMGAGNDTVRLGAAPGVLAAAPTTGAWTIAGGDGTDTLVTGSPVTSATTTGGYISGFEAVRVTNGSAVALSATANTISTVTFDAPGTTASVAGVASGATVNVITAGTATVSNTAWTTGTADSLTVNVGTSSTTGVFGATSIQATGVETVTVNHLARSGDTSARDITVGAAAGGQKTLVISAPGALTLTAAATTLTSVNASGVAGNLTYTTGVTTGTSVLGGAGNDTIGVAATSTGADTIDGGAGNDSISGGAGADSLIGSDGADTITGGTGADTMTGGTGADRFVFLANNTTAVTPVVTSTASAFDTITDFVSGTDKLDTPAVAFLGNYTNIQAALARQAQAGTLANSAAYVIGENTLYVFRNTNGTMNVDDLVIRLSSAVTSLQDADFLFGVQGQGNSINVATATSNISATLDTGGTERTAGGNTPVGSAFTTALDDHVYLNGSTTVTGAAAWNGATLEGGAGNDQITLAVGGVATASTTVTYATNPTVTGFERINLPDHTANVSLTLNAANIPANANRTFIVSGTSNAGLDANGGTLATALTITAAAFGATQAASITGGSGADDITGGAGNDIIDGGPGADTITAGAGNDSITGGLGNDTVAMATNLTVNDTVAGAGGVADTLTFSVGAATTDNAAGATALAAATRLDRVTGFETITMTGATNLTSGADQRTANTITVSASSGFAADAAVRVIGLAGNTPVSLDFTNVTAGSISVTGGNGADVLTGSNTLADTIDGGGGDDTLVGGGGADRFVISVAGDTSVSGGAGNDTIVAGAVLTAADIVSGGADTDTLTFTQAAAGAVATQLDNVTGVEILTYTPLTAGNAGDQRTLNALTPTATGAGVTFAADTAARALTVAADFAVAINFTNVTGGSVSITGAAGADAITGSNTLGDTLNGGAGDDTITGGGGNDSITAGEGTDVIVPGTGNDTIVLTETTSAIDTVRFAEGGSTNVDTITGGFLVGTDTIGLSTGNLTLVGSQLAAAVTPTWTGTIGADVVVGANATTQVFVNAAASSGTVNASAVNGVIKFTTGATSFAGAIGTTSITLGTTAVADGSTIVAVGEVILATWYDSAAGQMVVGFINSAADGVVGNITQNDQFVEVVRVGMTASEYAAFSIAGLVGY